VRRLTREVRIQAKIWSKFRGIYAIWKKKA
jgi:hypothetical protein